MRIGWREWLGVGLLLAQVAACTGGVDPGDGGLAIDSPEASWDSGRTDARPVPPADAALPDANLSGCTLTPQGGCPDGMACDLDRTDLAGGATECRAVTTEGTARSTCDLATECAAGYICRGANISVCRQFCGADADCGADRSCVVQLDSGDGTAVPGALVCSDACDPLTALDCPANLGCGLGVDPTRGVTFALCSPSGTGGEGAGCASDANCQRGFACANPGSAPRCLRWCTLTPQASDCPDGRVCTGFATPLVYRGVTYGLCAPQS